MPHAGLAHASRAAAGRLHRQQRRKAEVEARRAHQRLHSVAVRACSHRTTTVPQALGCTRGSARLRGGSMGEPALSWSIPRAWYLSWSTYTGVRLALSTRRGPNPRSSPASASSLSWTGQRPAPISYLRLVCAPRRWRSSTHCRRNRYAPLHMRVGALALCARHLLIASYSEPSGLPRSHVRTVPPC